MRQNAPAAERVSKSGPRFRGASQRAGVRRRWVPAVKRALGHGLLVGLAALAVGPRSATAQVEFLRGDANTDGVVDLSDASFILRSLFLSGAAPACGKSADCNDDGGVDLIDPILLFNYFFPGGGPIKPPYPSPGADPTPDALECVSYAPALAPRLADLTLGFECLGRPGPGRLQLAAILTTANNTAAEGSQGWSLSIGVEGYRVLSLTRDGTAAADDTATPPGYFKGNGRNSLSIVDPARVVESGPQGPGLVMGILLSLFESSALPRNGTERLLVFELEEDPPGGPGPRRVFYIDGKLGAGQPVRNVISMAGTAQQTTLESFERDCDCNQNGRDDAADVAQGSSQDCNGNDIPDECEPDCNGNAIADECDLAAGT